MTIKAFYTPPESWSKVKKLRHIGKSKITTPDTDNIIKAVLDGLNGLAYKDDNIVSEIVSGKYYGDENKTEIIIEEI